MDTSAFDSRSRRLIAQEAAEPRDRLAPAGRPPRARDLGAPDLRRPARPPRTGRRPGPEQLAGRPRPVGRRPRGDRRALGGPLPPDPGRRRLGDPGEDPGSARATGERVVVAAGPGADRRKPARRGAVVGPARRGRGGPRTLLEAHGSVPLPPYIRKGVEGDGDRAATRRSTPRSPARSRRRRRACTSRPRSSAGSTPGGSAASTSPCTSGSAPSGRSRPSGSRTTSSTPRRRADRRRRRGPQRSRAGGGRIVAVGTTSTRVLESACRAGPVRALRGRDGALPPARPRVPGRRRPAHQLPPPPEQPPRPGLGPGRGRPDPPRPTPRPSGSATASTATATPC